MNILKFVIAVLLLPLVLAVCFAFYNHLSNYPDNYNLFFKSGAVAFVLTFLFIHPFWGVHAIGQKIASTVFRFTAPFDRIFSNLIPMSSVVVLGVCFAIRATLGIESFDHYFMFFAGFFWMMHILLVAQDLQVNESNPLKPNYFFQFTFVVLIGVFLIVLMLDLVSGKFLIQDFIYSVLDETQRLYSLVFQRIVFFE